MRVEYTGQPFGRPDPKFLTKAWRLKNNFMAPTPVGALDEYRKQRFYEINAPLIMNGGPSLLRGEDAVTASRLGSGLPVYGGYFDGTYANLTEIRRRFPKAVVLSITPFGTEGARCVDIEPGDCRPSDAPAFFRNLVHGGDGMGQGDQGKPMFYCSAGDSQAVINALANSGVSRTEYDLFSAHWIGYHICGPHTCGYPQADATQYASNNDFDSDVFYAYCFETVPNPPANWVFTPVRDLTVVSTGPKSVKLSWSSPGTVKPLGVSEYETTIRQGGKDVVTYPRYEPKGNNPEVHQFGSLNPASSYTAYVRAIATDGGHASPWAWVNFDTKAA